MYRRKVRQGQKVTISQSRACMGVLISRVGVKPGLWTLDWTHGLDCGLRFGLDFGLMRWAMTTISNNKLRPIECAMNVLRSCLYFNIKM